MTAARLLRCCALLLVPAVTALATIRVAPALPMVRTDLESDILVLDDVASATLARMAGRTASACSDTQAPLRHAHATGRLRNADLRLAPAQGGRLVR